MKVKNLNVPVTSTKVDVANWLQQVESKFKFRSIGALKKKKEKEKDNQYKLKKAMAIAIGLIVMRALTDLHNINRTQQHTGYKVHV